MLWTFHLGALGGLNGEIKAPGLFPDGGSAGFLFAGIFGGGGGGLESTFIGGGGGGGAGGGDGGGGGGGGVCC